MEIPNLVRSALGGEAVEAGVNLGDEDLVCLTPTRTLLYRAEGLLSDEKVEEFPHEVERLDVKEGRRKTKFVLEYVDGARSLSVPSSRDTPVLELLMTGILRAADVTGPDETVAGAFRFSELALVVTDARVVKHIGSSVWSSDYEEFPFDDLTGLAFERASVATELVLEVGGRPQRIKTPNEDARKVQQVLEDAVFEYYGVDSLEALNAKIDTGEAATDASESGDDGGGDIGFGSGIDPLVSDDADETATAGSGAGTDDAAAAGGNAAESYPEPRTGSAERTGSTGATGDTTDATGADAADVEAMQERLDELSAAVRRQNQLLEKQQRTIQQLIEELREGR